jgi:hypothetical protein
METAIHRNFCVFPGNRDSREMARNDLSEIHKWELPLFINHRVDGQRSAKHSYDFKLLLVQRIALEVTIRCKWVSHKTCAVKRGNCFGMRQARGYDLSTARIAGHEMRLHQSGSNPQIRFNKTLIDPYNGASRLRASEVNMLGIVTSVMVFDTRILAHPWITY